MTPERLTEALGELLARDEQPVLETWPVASGMNSVTAGLRLAGGRYVAKWVPGPAREALVGGARVAREMAAHGIRAGEPLELPGGGLTVGVDDGEAALLREVAGRPLTAALDDQAAWGAALGRLHAAAPRDEGEVFFPWLREEGLDPAREDWVRSAAAVVLAEHDGVRGLTWAQLHTDPAPEAFLQDEDGDVGVIDWTGSVAGPALYDVASAVMYAGGPARAAVLLEAYAATSGLPASELRAHLTAFRAFRAVVQAVYFSGRLAAGDLTGIPSQDGNVEGLRDAEGMLRELGVIPAQHRSR